MQVAIIPKESRYTYTLKRSNLKASEIRAYLTHTGLSDKRINAIVCSHERQKENFDTICGRFMRHNLDVISREDLTKECLNQYDLIIAFGGDNHFQYVASFVEKVPILGINSDPETSVGHLTRFNVKSSLLAEDSPLLTRGEFSVESWTRMRAAIDGHDVTTLALSEIYLGEKSRLIMSRFLVEGVTDVSVRSSGIICSTGAGSSGWYNSAVKGKPWEPTVEGFSCAALEPFGDTPTFPKAGCLNSIHITSLNDTNGIISIDCLREYPFPEGSRAYIGIGDPLNVVNNV